MGGGSGVKVWNDCYPAHQLACCWEGGGGGGGGGGVLLLWVSLYALVFTTPNLLAMLLHILIICN